MQPITDCPVAQGLAPFVPVPPLPFVEPEVSDKAAIEVSPPSKLSPSEFLQNLYGDEFSGFVAISWPPTSGWGVHACLSAEQLDRIDNYAGEIEVYFSQGLLAEAPAKDKRATSEGVIAIHGCWIDLDFEKKDQKKPYPPRHVAEEIIRELGPRLRPSVVIESGRGLHVYFAFRDLFTIETEVERELAGYLVWGLQELVRTKLRRRGYDCDSTHDLARVLRLPGSVNSKCGATVRFADGYGLPPWQRYYPSEIEALLSDENITLEAYASDRGSEQIALGGSYRNGLSDNTRAKLSVLLANSEEFRGTWEHTRPPYDTSPSGWEGELAVQTSEAGWSDSEIAELIADHRRRPGTPKPWKATRLSYLVLTLKYGRKGAKKRRAASADSTDHLSYGDGDGDLESATETADVTSDQPTPSEPSLEAEPAPAPGAAQSSAAERSKSAKPRYLTDIGNADRFVGQHGECVKYVPAWDRWLVWDGKRWKSDELREVHRRGEATLLSITDEARVNKSDKRLRKWAEQSQSHARLPAMLKFVEHRVAVSPDSLDAKPWLLNCQNGTLNLETGELQPHDRGDLITKILPTDFDREARCPIWDATLARLLPDPAVREFLARAFGLALVGKVIEHKLFIFFGTGANGKTLVLSTLGELLGDYSRAAPPELLANHRFAPHPTMLAGLEGFRLVTAAETADQMSLNEAQVKLITGGDRVSARRMGQDFRDFEPQFTLFLATNYRPAVRGTDDGIWRRLCLVPFDVSVPPHEQDPLLRDKLRAEWPGILAWAVRGLADYRERKQQGLDGLGAPQAVEAATHDYRAQSDSVQRFVNEQCKLAPEARVRKSRLYQLYKHWCQSEGETQPLSSQAFRASLARLGVEVVKCGGYMEFRGVAHEGCFE